MQSADRTQGSTLQLSLYPALEWLLRASVALVLLGRAWQHLRYDTPLSALLWSQDLIGGVVERLLGMTWQAWAASPRVAGALGAVEHALGALYLAAGLAALAPVTGQAARRAQRALLWASAFGLLALAWLSYLDHKRQAGQLLELAIQCSLPLVLAQVLKGSGRLTARHQRALRLATSATFAGHALYAIGYYEVPGHFVTMVMRSLHVGEGAARGVLLAAGCMDFAVALGVLASGRWCGVQRAVLLYAAGWGTLTAFARLWSFFRWDMAFERLEQWLHETALRLPHGLVPLFVLLVLWQQARVPRSPHLKWSESS